MSSALQVWYVSYGGIFRRVADCGRIVIGLPGHNIICIETSDVLDYPPNPVWFVRNSSRLPVESINHPPGV